MGKKKYPGTVLERLNRKLVALRNLNRPPRPPPGTYVPRSLREFARWYDESLGIYPVASPNEVTTTHPRYGRIANEAQQLLEKLRSATAEKDRRARLGERCSA